ncbi:MAG: glycosyltransferase family 25 protein [Hyphomonadaceae bacterium]|nr:glycosyltransferase family 25 protein [Hyphomonadaceae bacterium]
MSACHLGAQMTTGIVVINLDQDAQRMAHMRSELDRVGLPFLRFSALRGDALPAGLARYFPVGIELTLGEIGCYASHLALMQRVIDGELPSPLLVLEDDVGLPNDLDEALQTLLAALPQQWDIVRLSYPTKLIAPTIAALGADRYLVRYSRVPTTTGAYLISASGARKFLAARPRSLPVDHDLRHVWNWDLNTFGVEPPLVAHDVLNSSSIDALSSAARARGHRRRQGTQSILRQAKRGIRDFGLLRWLALGPLNLVARVTPRGVRRSFIRWANLRLV